VKNKALRFWKIFAVLLLVLNIILIGFLFLRPFSVMQPGLKTAEAPGKYLVEKLKLTMPQQTVLNKLRQNRNKTFLAVQAKDKKLRTIFFGGLRTDPGNSNLDSIANKIAENQKQIALINYYHYQEIRKMCTAEQKVIFDDIILDVLERLNIIRSQSNNVRSKLPQDGQGRIDSAIQK
jgi:protein CpxP